MTIALGLVMFLSNSDAEIVVIALEALEFMTLYKVSLLTAFSMILFVDCRSFKGHKSVMAAEEGLAAALRKLMFSQNPQIKKVALAVYSNIQDNIPQKDNTARAPSQEQSQQGVVGQAIETHKMSSARTYHVYIKGLNTLIVVLHT